MKIRYAKRFVKQFSKLKPAERARFYERQGLLERDPFHVLLNHHTLKGKFAGLHSINVSGDLRALYKEVNDEMVLFQLIGTHRQLYE